MQMRALRSALLIMLHASHAHATGIDPTADVPVCTTAYLKFSGFATTDRFGGTLVTWVDLRNDSLGDVYVQRLGSEGRLRWKVNGIEVCGAAGRQSKPAAAADGEGGAYVVWQDNRSAKSRVYLQHVSEVGRTTLEPDGLPLGAPDHFGFDPSVVGDGSGGAIVEWSDAADVQLAQVAQRIDRNGRLVWQPRGVAIDSSSSPVGLLRARLLAGSVGEAIVLIEGPGGVTLRKLGPRGELVWPESGVTVRDRVPVELGAVPDGSGGTLLTWRTGFTNLGDTLLAQHVTHDGQRSWGQGGQVVFAGTDVQDSPTIASNEDGGAFVVWRNQGFTNPRIFAQRLDPVGNRMWGTNGIRVAPIGRNQSIVGARAASGGSLLVAWQANLGSPGSDLFAQRLDGSGDLMWDPDGARLTTASAQSVNPQLELRGGAGATLIWEGVHDGGKAIVANSLNPLGFPGLAPANSGPDGVFLWSPAPNPARREVTIRFALRNSLTLSLVVLDLEGRQIRTLWRGATSMGMHTIVWDGTGDDRSPCRSGVYFVRCATAAGELVTRFTLLQ